MTRAFAASRCVCAQSSAHDDRQVPHSPWAVASNGAASFASATRSNVSISVNTACSTPVQALPVLHAVIPLRRANMRLRLQVAPQAEEDLELLLRQQHAIIESQEATAAQAR